MTKKSPYISKHISRNGGATIKASRKTALDKVFFILGQKGHFFSKNGGTIKKKVIALNMYIGTNVLVYERWLVLKVQYTAGRLHQHFRNSIDSHCLCMSQ